MIRFRRAMVIGRTVPSARCRYSCKHTDAIATDAPCHPAVSSPATPTFILQDSDQDLPGFENRSIFGMSASTVTREPMVASVFNAQVGSGRSRHLQIASLRSPTYVLWRATIWRKMSSWSATSFRVGLVLKLDVPGRFGLSHAYKSLGAFDTDALRNINSIQDDLPASASDIAAGDEL